MRRLDNIDLRLVRVFVTVVEAGGFGPAQIALNLGQSTLSTHVASLERKLGQRLCERGRRGFRLTEAGRATYEAAKILFADIEAFHARIGGAGGRLTGRLRVGVVDGVVTSPELGLQGAIGRFRRAAPDVFLDLRLATPDALERAVAEGERDIAVGPMSQKVSGLVYRPLCREPHALYCGSGHPLFDRPEAEIAPADIEAAAFSVRGYRHFDDLYRAHHPRPEGTVMQMEAQVMMILSGAYVGFLPRHIGDGLAARGEMRALLPRRYAFASQHFVATRADMGEPALSAAFAAALAEELAERAASGAAGAGPEAGAGRQPVKRRPAPAPAMAAEAAGVARPPRRGGRGGPT